MNFVRRRDCAVHSLGHPEPTRKPHRKSGVGKQMATPAEFSVRGVAEITRGVHGPPPRPVQILLEPDDANQITK
jgi:hypothetical protein